MTPDENSLLRESRFDKDVICLKTFFEKFEDDNDDDDDLPVSLHLTNVKLN